MRTGPPAESAPCQPTVVVLGGGINGAALARQLVLAGTSVVIADTGDLAGGTTAWSTRLIHGGLRYLEYGEFDLVRESLAERNRLVRLAPHLVRPLPFAIPLARRGGGLLAAAARLVGWESLARRLAGGGRGSLAVGIGLWLYDRFSSDPAWPRHRMVSSTAAGLPELDQGRFPFVATYADAQCLFPERLTVEWLVDARQAAVERGVSLQVLPHHSWRSLEDGRLEFSPQRQSQTSDQTAPIRVQPEAIVNATGAWVDQTVAALAAGDGPLAGEPTAGRFIRGTKGSHLVIHNERLWQAVRGQGIYAEAGDGRPVFVLPFADSQVLVGTTDIPFSGDPADARTDEAEIDYLLAAVAAIFPDCQPAAADVVQHYCGVRPLPGPAVTGRLAGTPGAVTRRHLLLRHRQARLPTWSIVGGKLTTCRSLAEESAAEILETLGLPAGDPARERPLPGRLAADGTGSRAAAAVAAGAAGIPAEALEDAVDRTLQLFGSRAVEVFEAAAVSSVLRKLPPLLGDSGLPTAAAAFAVEQEWAETLSDLVERRLMLLFSPRLSVATLTALAELLVATGRLEATALADAVAAEVAHLQDCCRKRLSDSKPL